MKIFQKYLYVLALTAALLGIAVAFSPETERPLPRFLVQSPDGTHAQEISIFDAGDGNYYVFLPSYADLNQVSVFCSRGQDFSLEEVPLSDGMFCGSFELETPYRFAVGHETIAQLWFYRSANVATMYVDTVSGNMKYLHQNKDHKETAPMVLYTADGKESFSDEFSVLKGRGNASWEYDKRPYNLTLSTEGALLGMKSSKNWILLANAADETNLNNQLTLDLASRVGLQWTPHCQWVDLYLNGEYSGLYLLTEKVEVHENRLDIAADPSAFLGKVDLVERWATLRNPFFSASQRAVEISYPQHLTIDRQAEIEELVNQLEAEILSGRDLRDSRLLDLDSWVRRYLIDEISANIDSDLASSYFYYSHGKFFAGPVWDYDMTFGNDRRNHDPDSFVAKNAKKSSAKASIYYRALYQNESFYNQMVEIYRRDLKPEIQKLLTGEIDQRIAFLHKASQSNSLRWRSMYDNLPADVVHTPSALKEYFARRIAFLDRAWLDGVPYCTVQFESYPGSSYMSVSVEQGHCLESDYINIETVVWIDTETGNVFDFRQPIWADKLLTRKRS